MSLTAFPLESSMSGTDDYGNPIFDRAVDSAFYRAFWAKYFTDGIFLEPADSFLVSPRNGMELTVKLGECHIKGLTAAPVYESEEIIRLDPPGATADRTDRIVIRADFHIERAVSLQVYKDWKQTDKLRRDSDVWELGIADVLVKRNAVAIETVNITDLRLNTELCGIVTEPFVRTNTQAFFTQLEAEHDRVLNDWEEQKLSQQSVWQAQLDEQDAVYRAHEAQLSEWFARYRFDIEALKTFDFDNIASIRGCTRQTLFDGDNITEKILATTTGKTFAERLTTMTETGATQLLRIYDADGETVANEVSSVITFGEHGVTEIVE